MPKDYLPPKGNPCGISLPGPKNAMPLWCYHRPGKIGPFARHPAERSTPFLGSWETIEKTTSFGVLSDHFPEMKNKTGFWHCFCKSY
jgi:hypothetical protein